MKRGGAGVYSMNREHNMYRERGGAEVQMGEGGSRRVPKGEGQGA